MTRFVSLLGLGFGDCGKGLFTDFLSRDWQAHTVVRFNGGAQAGHNVVLPDGRHHVFSQFSAGTLVPGVVSVLASPVVVHPSALLMENAALCAIGIHDGLQRLIIDGRCRINTPFHQAAGRLREWQRGAAAHGTCGVGVGETVRHGLQYPEQILRYADLCQPALCLEKLHACRRTLQAQLAPVTEHCPLQAEWQILHDEGIAERWLIQIAPLLQSVAPAKQADIAARLQLPGTVLFEGAQGVLLDEWRGFHPHTTWSTIHPKAVEAVLADVGIEAPVQHFGVLRSYLTRHGQGPLPSQDSALDCLPEMHNHASGWQGNFRRGQPDAVLLRYAMAVCGQLDGLLVSHLDVFDQIAGLKWCQAYQTNQGEISDLPLGDYGDLSHQIALTDLLMTARAVFAPDWICTPNALLADLERICKCKVLLTSYGANYKSIIRIQTNDFF
jgi:adenylosuccinate synthase